MGLGTMWLPGLRAELPMAGPGASLASSSPAVSKALHPVLRQRPGATPRTAGMAVVQGSGPAPPLQAAHVLDSQVGSGRAGWVQVMSHRDGAAEAGLGS